MARFQPEVIQKAVALLWNGPLDSDLDTDRILEVESAGAVWNHDSEAEFFSDYRAGQGKARFGRASADRELTVTVNEYWSSVSVQAQTRTTIHAVFEVFDANLASSLRPTPPVPRPPIFIGHGRSTAWRDLKDHLQDKHGYDVEAYEVGARAGHAVRDALEQMLKKSAFAVLVMTGEDEAAGEMRARQNVVHEAGLFQGRLGFSRAIILLEEGTATFSNIDGIEQIHFPRGRIREAFGDVLATIRREFIGAV